MIAEIKVTDPERTPVKWWPSVTALKDLQLTLTPGLTILLGENGSGKSTLLLAVARQLHCAQGGRSVVTQTSVLEVFRDHTYLNGLQLTHDGQSVRYVDPSRKLGMAGAAFDEDFFMEGVVSAALKGSAGQLVIKRVLDAVAAKPVSVEWAMQRDHVNDLWQKRLDDVAQELTAKIPVGPPTILLDEPDRSLSLPNQKQLWAALPRLAKKVQVIVATHSSFALDVAGATYVELTPGYRAAATG